MSTAEFQSRILTVNFFLKSATTFIKNTGAVDLQKKLAHAVRDWVFTNTDMMQEKLLLNRHQKCATIKRYDSKFHHRQSDYF